MPDGTNRYAYVANRPTVAVDPTGLAVFLFGGGSSVNNRNAPLMIQRLGGEHGAALAPAVNNGQKLFEFNMLTPASRAVAELDSECSPNDPIIVITNSRGIVPAKEFMRLIRSSSRTPVDQRYADLVITIDAMDGSGLFSSNPFKGHLQGPRPAPTPFAELHNIRQINDLPLFDEPLFPNGLVEAIGDSDPFGFLGRFGASAKAFTGFKFQGVSGRNELVIQGGDIHHGNILQDRRTQLQVGLILSQFFDIGSQAAGAR